MPPGRPLDSKKLDSMTLVQDTGPLTRGRFCMARVLPAPLLACVVLYLAAHYRSCPGSSSLYLGISALPAISAAGNASDHGQFLYLVTGASAPGATWVALSQQDNVHVIFASWRYNVGRAFNNSKLRLHFYPESTWSQSRNFLFSKVAGLERELAFRMSYIVFADEDLVLHYRSHGNPRFIVSSPLGSALRLHQLLMRDRPARASVEYTRTHAQLMQLTTDCVQSCAFDGALDIFHRSIVGAFMPYSVKYDRHSWPMAQLVLNLRAQALMRQHCNLYREVFVDFGSNRHGTYPTDYDIMDNVTEFVSDCLLGRGFPLYPGPDRSHQDIKMLAAFRPKPEQDVQLCQTQSQGINYAKKFATQLKKWPRVCR